MLELPVFFIGELGPGFWVLYLPWVELEETSSVLHLVKGPTFDHRECCPHFSTTYYSRNSSAIITPPPPPPPPPPRLSHCANLLYHNYFLDRQHKN